jgi:CheY-like chemotaxis protein
MPRKYPSPGTHCGTGYAARSLVPGRDGGEDAVEDRSQEGRKHIFAINGAPEFLNIVRELFQEEAYNVTTTNFAPNSFAQIEALQPDALIIDIAIGQEAGWELLDQLGADADTAGIPVLVVSTDPRLLTRAQEQAARYGMHRYLEKPFDIDALLTNIQELGGAA